MTRLFGYGVALSIMVAGCGDDSTSSSGGTGGAGGGGESASGGGGEASEAGSWELSYEQAFPQDRVLELRIELSAENWAAMLSDMEELTGNEFGSGNMGGPGGPPGGGPPGGGQAGGGGIEFFSRDPVYVPARLVVDGAAWDNVGLRFKGNSSLASSWSGGIYKMPLRIKMDEFEDDYPELADQRFFGFKSISLANGWSDPSLLHEKLATEVFAAAGVRAPATAFYAVTVKHGEETNYFGLYTAVELPDEKTFLEGQFGADDLNVYKPEGDAATWASYDEEQLGKKTNETAADFSDVSALYANLQADRSDPAAWRTDLESSFDVDGYLSWLAVNTALGDWDQYGQMSHNYYLVQAAEDDARLVWVPWDHTFAFSLQKASSLGHDEIDESWPLIRYLLDDEVYAAAYRDKLAAVFDEALAPSEFSQRVQEASELISPYALAEQSGFTFTSSSEFQQDVDELTSFASTRQSSVETFLAQ